MPRGKATSAICSFCAQSVTKSSAARHFGRCSLFQSAVERAERSKRRPERLFRIRTQDAVGGLFWLDLEMRASATLQDLDDYLRAIWLECCGHMSQFSVGGWRGDEIPKSRRAAKVFAPRLELTHIYDFGTESETRIKTLGMREGKPLDSHPIALLARNVMPEVRCAECGAAGTHLCVECPAEHGRPGILCTTHAETHSCDQYGEPLRLMNSPRMGLCGYSGPADPPYGRGRPGGAWVPDDVS